MLFTWSSLGQKQAARADGHVRRKTIPGCGANRSSSAETENINKTGQVMKNTGEGLAQRTYITLHWSIDIKAA